MLNPFSKFAAVRQFNLAKAMAKKGHEVTLILPQFDKYSGYKPLKIEKVKNLRIIHPFQIKSKILEISMLFYIPSAIKRAMNYKYDIVHGFRPTPFSGYIGYKIAKKQNIPFVQEMGDIEWETMRDLKTHPSYRVKIVKWLERFLLERADGVTTLNERVRKYVINNYNIKVPSIAVSNGVDCSLFKPMKVNKLRSKLLDETKAKKLLVFSGKLDHVSHIVDMVKVLPLLGDSYGLVIIGDGDEKYRLEELASKLDISSKVLFLGRLQQDNIPKYLNCADVLIAPFKKEKGVEYASNLKIFEYMAIGKPIVASDVGLIGEILDKRGYIYKPGDLKEMVLRIKKASLKIGKVAREEALKRYDWYVLSKEIIELYKELQKS